MIMEPRGWIRQGEKRLIETYLLRAPVTLANVLAALQPLQDLTGSRLLFLELLHLQRLATTASLLAQGLESLLDELDVLDAQLLADDGQIADGVDITLDVNNLGIIEASYHLENGIDSADVRQESVTQTGTGRRAAGQTSNIIDSQVGGHLRLGLVVLAQPVEPLIRNDDAGLFGVDGSIREVGRVTQRGLCDRLEECRLADVRKTNLEPL